MTPESFDCSSLNDLIRHLRPGAKITQAELAGRLQRVSVHVHPDGIDRAQIQQHLAMTPEQRIRAVANVNRFVADERRAD